MRLAIDIDGVLRDTFSKIEQLYQKYFIDELEIVDDEFVYEIKTPYNTPDYQNHFMFHGFNCCFRQNFLSPDPVILICSVRRYLEI